MTSISHKSGFSWHRVGLLFNYYFPLMRLQLTIYLVVSFIMAILMIIPFPQPVKMGIYTVEWAIIPYMFMLAPCALGKLGHGGATDRMLPATAAEKMTFYMIYFMGFIWLSVYLLPCAAQFIYEFYLAGENSPLLDLMQLQRSLPLRGYVSNVFSSVAGSLICLYFVSRVQNNKVLIGVVSVISMNIALGILGGVAGIIYVFSRGFADGFANLALMDEEAIGEMTKDVIMTFALAGAIVMGIVSAVFFILNYRLLRNR